MGDRPTVRPSSEDQSQRSALRVLIAERHPPTLRMLQLVVERAGGIAHGVSAREDLALALESHLFHLLLLDADMATAAELREWTPDGDAPAIAIIGAVSDGDDFCDCEQVGRPVALDRIDALMAYWSGTCPPRSANTDPLPPLCAAPVLDQRMIADLYALQAETYQGAVEDMIQIYLQNTPARLDALRSAIDEDDHFRVRWNAACFGRRLGHLRGALDGSAMRRAARMRARGRSELRPIVARVARCPSTSLSGSSCRRL